MKKLIIALLIYLPLIAQQPQAQQGQPISAVNAKYVQGVGPGYWPTKVSGLTLHLSPGSIVCSTIPTGYVGGNLTMTDNATNYVYLDTSSACAPASNTTGFTSNNSPIAVVTTSGGSITNVQDYRPMGVGSGGGGGGNAPNARTRILYASVFGSDSNDCLTWATPCGSVMGAYDKLPTGGGTIYVTATDSAIPACKAGDPAGCGIWIMGSTDPNYGSPPAGWRKAKLSVAIIGVGASNQAAFSQGPQAWINAGDGSNPAMWLSDVYTHTFKNIQFQYPKEGLRFGVDSTNNPANVNTSSWDDLFENISFHIPQSAGSGPSVTIGTNCFWDTFKDVQFQGNVAEVAQISTLSRSSGTVTATLTATHPSSWSGTLKLSVDGASDPTFNTSPVTATVTGGTTITYTQNLPNASATGGYMASDAAQNVLIAPSGGPGVGDIVFDHVFVSLTGIRNYGANGINVDASNIYQEGGESPVFDLVGCPAQSVISYVFLADTVALGMSGIRVGNSPPSCNLLNVLSSPSDGPLTGQQTNPGNVKVLPSVYGQTTQVDGRFYGTTLATKRAFTPTVSRFVNHANQLASSWGGNGCGIGKTAGTPVSAPDGTSNAGEVTTGSTTIACFNNYNPGTMQVGDTIVFGAWARSATANGYNSSAIAVNCGSCKILSGISYIGFTGSLGNSVSVGNTGTQGQVGEWQWLWGTATVATTTGADTVQFFGNASSTHTADFFAPVLYYIPVGTYTNNELGEISQNFQATRNDSLPGVVSTLAGESFQADNYSEFFTAGSGGVTANTLVQLDSSNPVKVIATTTKVYGVALNTASSGNSVQVARNGFVSCVTDTGGSTAGNFAIIGTGTAVNCKDSGTSDRSTIAITTRVVGQFKTTATAGNTAIVELEPYGYGTLAAGTGTVTSVGLVSPSFFAVSGSPVTASGNITQSYATGLSANLVLSTDNTGAAGLRALTTAMLPTAIQNNSTTNTQPTGDSSTKVATTAFVANTLAAPPAIGNTTPAAGTFTTLLATGVMSGYAPITITTGASASIGGTYSTGYYFNQNVTAATAITYTLPTAAAGKQYCVANSDVAGTPNTGTLQVNTSASGQYIHSGGSRSASGGYIISAGAAGDRACFIGTTSTDWEEYTQSGTWTLH